MNPQDKTSIGIMLVFALALMLLFHMCRKVNEMPLPRRDMVHQPPLKQPDPNCKHENFSARVDCHRVAKSDSPNAVPYLWTAELSVKCEACGGDFMFDGLPWAISLKQPCCNVAASVATLPMRPYDGTMRSGTCVVQMP